MFRVRILNQTGGEAPGDHSRLIIENEAGEVAVDLLMFNAVEVDDDDRIGPRDIAMNATGLHLQVSDQLYAND